MTETFKINREKFLGELKKRDLTMADVAKEMGRSQKYISNKVREGKEFSKSDIKFIQTLYNISYDSYKCEEKITSEEIVKTDDKLKTTQVMSKKEFRDVIYDAVYNAVRDAWSADKMDATPQQMSLPIEREEIPF